MPEALKKAIQPLQTDMGKLNNAPGLGGAKILGISSPADPISTAVTNKLISRFGKDPMNLFGGGEGPTPPTILPPTRMPTSGDKQAANRQSIIDQLRRRGRASTILTDNTDTLG